MRRSWPIIRPSAWRRIGQGIFLTLFLVLFIRTDYSGVDTLNQGVNLFFRFDPFLALVVMLAAQTIVALMLPALAILLLTFIFGRFFCGGICPMGTLIDGCRLLFGRPGGSPQPGLRQWKYALLFFLLTAAFFGLPLGGYLDPFSLLVRGFTFALHPALDHAATVFFTWTYQHAPNWVNQITEPIYTLLKATILPFSAKVYSLSILSLLLLLIALVLSRIESRFFCRKVCPLGALLALVSRFALFRLKGGSEECGKCRLCSTLCRMGAIDHARAINPSECILCLDCLSQCPQERIQYRLQGLSGTRPATNLSRRAIMASMAAGALAPLALPSRPMARHSDPALIRPPGALAEAAFVAQCVRCGECMKVCIGNALHATWLQAGLEGIFTPRLIGRLGYCEYNCTLCGQVCPTGAIRKISTMDKHSVVIGHAFFDKNRCLPYASAIPCIVCEEHCPTPIKAIQFREVDVENGQGGRVRLRQPFVVENLCIGCGICEHKCPIQGEAAIRVTSAGESRHPATNVAGGYA